MMIRFILGTVVFCHTLCVVQAGGFKDDFSSDQHPVRQALRGEWIYKDNTVTCQADPELYKKYQDHGPILRWPCEFADGTIEFEMKAKDCQRIVFTLNNETGHVFRMSFVEKPPAKSRIFGWAKPSIDSKPDAIVSEGIPNASDFADKWVKGKLTIQGDTAEFTLGEYSTSMKHASLGRTKGEVTLSFAFGELAVRNVSVTTK